MSPVHEKSFCKHEHEGHKLPVVVRLYGPLHPTMHFTVSGHASATEGRDSVVVLSTGLGVAIPKQLHGGHSPGLALPISNPFLQTSRHWAILGHLLMILSKLGMLEDASECWCDSFNPSAEHSGPRQPIPDVCGGTCGSVCWTGNIGIDCFAGKSGINCVAIISGGACVTNIGCDITGTWESWTVTGFKQSQVGQLSPPVLYPKSHFTAQEKLGRQVREDWITVVCISTVNLVSEGLIQSHVGHPKLSHL